MTLRVANPVIWMLRGVVPTKRTARPNFPDRKATHFGPSLQPDRWSSEGGLAAIIVIAVLGQAAPATFVLLRVDGATGPIEKILFLSNIVQISAFWSIIKNQVERNNFQPAHVIRFADHAFCRCFPGKE